MRISDWSSDVCSSDLELIELAKKEMAILGLCDAADVVGGAVVRQEKDYPVYDDTYDDNGRMMREELEAKYPTLNLVGRNGMHSYNNKDHTIQTAMMKVRKYKWGGRSYDIWGGKG